MKSITIVFALFCVYANASPHLKSESKLAPPVVKQSQDKAIVCSAPGQRIPDPSDCTAFYVCDSSYYPVHAYCGAGQSFSKYSLNCIPYNAAECETIPLTCSAPGQRFPDAHDCTAFYICDSSYTPIHSYCAPGETFSQYSLTCILYDPSQCYGGATAPPATTSVVHPVTCGFASEILPDPYDCAIYYLCDQNRIPQYFHCSQQLWYDPAYGGCNFIDRVTCSGGYRPLPLPSALPATGYVGAVPICTRPAELHGNYEDCNQYWKCSASNNPEPFKCPYDLFFDHFTNVCELAATANCEVGKLDEDSKDF